MFKPTHVGQEIDRYRIIQSTIVIVQFVNIKLLEYSFGLSHTDHNSLKTFQLVLTWHSAIGSTLYTGPSMSTVLLCSINSQNCGMLLYVRCLHRYISWISFRLKKSNKCNLIKFLKCPFSLKKDLTLKIPLCTPILKQYFI